MKNNLLNVILYCLTEQMGYNPDKNSKDKNIIVVKKHMKHLTEYIELVDGDNVDMEEMRLFDESNDRSFHILKVLIFDKIVDKIKIDEIKGYNKNVIIASICIFSGELILYSGERLLFQNELFSIQSIVEEGLHENYQSLNNNDFAECEINYIVKEPVLTYLLAGINAFVFLALSFYSLISPLNYNELLYFFGSKVNTNILEGEYWRLFTPMFLHADIKHMLFNGISLLFLGSIVERLFGHKKFILLYIVSGIYGSIFSFCFTEENSVGASGAIFGMLGVIIFYGLSKKGFYKTVLGLNIILMLGINVFFGLMNPNIDNFAHFGGLLCGYFLTGLIYNNKEKKELVYLSKEFCIFFLVTITSFCYIIRYF